MADLKISQLGSIVTVVPATDVLPVVQGATTFKITPNQILGSGGTATLASATITGALSAAGLNVTSATIPANGVYLGSANNLSFSAASTLGMILNSTGLGIGVSPLNNLHVKGASGATTIRLEAITDGIIGFIGSASGLITGSPANNIALRAENGLYLSGGGNSPQFILNSAGNVGLGVVPVAGNGVIQLSAGVGFPATQVASANANTLDDYEEGTWVPTDASGAALVFTVSNCRYTKVGRLVTVQGSITYPVTASGAATSWGGFPFNAGDIFALNIIYTDASVANLTYISSNTVNAFLLTPGVNVTNSTVSGKAIVFSGTYMV